MKVIGQAAKFGDEMRDGVFYDQWDYLHDFVDAFDKSQIYTLEKYDKKVGPIAKIAQLLSNEAKGIGTIMTNLDSIDLGDIELSSTVKPILEYDGEHTYTVNAGKVAVNVKMNVIMNAGEVAQSISVAADGESYFQLTEKGTAAIADMEDV